MNVTQVLQSATGTKSKEKEAKTNNAEFLKAFEKQTKITNGKKNSSSNKDAKSDKLEEKSLKSGKNSEEKVENESEEDSLTFTLVNPFLNLDAQVKDLEKLETEATLHTKKGLGETRLVMNGLEINSHKDTSTVNQKMIVKEGEIDSSLLQNQISGSKTTDTQQLSEGQVLKNGSLDTANAAKMIHVDNKAKVIDGDQKNPNDTSIKTETQTKEVLSHLSMESIKSDSELSDKVSSKLGAVKNLLNEQKVNELLVENKQSIPLKDFKDKSLMNGEVTQTILDESTNNKSVTTSEVVNKTKQFEQKTVINNFKQTLETKLAEKSNATQSDSNHVSSLRQVESQPLNLQSQSGQQVEQSASKTRIPQEQGMHLVKDMVSNLIENKEGQKTYQTTLHLTPETLGKVVVELSFNEEGLSGKLIFQSDEARRFIEGEWMDLKQPLESKGVAIKAFDFTTSQQSQQQANFSFSGESSQSDQESQKQSFKENRQTVLSEEDEQIGEKNNTQKNGLNVYV